MDSSVLDFFKFDTTLADLNSDFFIRFGLNLFFLVVISRFVYFPQSRNRDTVFSHLMLGIMLFLVAHMMTGIKISLGFAFGALAIFRLLRYRTEPLASKDLTYLVIITAVSSLNAMAKMTYLEFVIVNSLVVLITLLAQSHVFLPQSYSKLVEYEKIDLIQPARRKELFLDLQQRTGLNIDRIEVGDLDFLRDTATIRLFYRQADVRISENKNDADKVKIVDTLLANPQV